MRPKRVIKEPSWRTNRARTVPVISLALLLLTPGCARRDDWYGENELSFKRRFSITLVNTIDENRPAAPLALDVPALAERDRLFRPDLCMVVDPKRGPLSSQADDLDGDGLYEELIFQCDLRPGENKRIDIYYLPDRIFARSYKPGVDAGLWRRMGGKTFRVSSDRVPPGRHGDSIHRLDGPAWESKSIGYRVFLDSRLAGDIFGKRRPTLILDSISQPDIDYLSDSDWGRDILAVGESLGLGGFGIWFDDRLHRPMEADSLSCRVPARGPVRTVVKMTVHGWLVGARKHDVTARFVIWAGERHTAVTITSDDGDRDLCIAAGIVRKETSPIRFDLGQGWLYTRGPGAADGGELIMSLAFPPESLLRLTGDDLNHLALLKKDRDGKIEYRFLARWDKEPSPMPERKELEDYLTGINRLDAEPINVERITTEIK